MIIEQLAREKYPYPQRNQWGGVPTEYLRDCEIIDRERKAYAEGLGEAANSALTPFYDLAKKLGVSVDFSSKSYDGDLQPPMDAYGFAEYLGEAAHQRDGWIAEKPELNKECLLLTASYIKSHSRIGHSYWSYHLFEIFWISFDDGGYWGVLQDGEEWGDIADIKADLYQIVQIPQNKDK
jgi:hypothetical protein